MTKIPLTIEVAIDYPIVARKTRSSGKRLSDSRFDIAVEIGYFVGFYALNLLKLYTNGKRRFPGIIFILYVVPINVIGHVRTVNFLRKFFQFKFTREQCWKQLIIGSYLTSCLFQYSLVQNSTVGEMDSSFLSVLYGGRRDTLQ